MRSIYFDGNTGTPDTARTLLYLHPLQELLTPDRGDPARRIPVMPGSVRQAATLPVARQKHFARPQPVGCVNPWPPRFARALTDRIGVSAQKGACSLR